MSMKGIYEICNLNDGRATAYVGSSIGIEKRWQQHRADLRHDVHHNQYLQNAWNKYGKAAFGWGVIEEVNDAAQLLSCEQYWLDRYLENPATCYNIAVTASPTGSMSDETKRKISNSLTGRALSSEHKRNVSEAMKGHKISKETRLKIGKTIRAKWSRGECGPNVGCSFQGKSLTEEHKRRISEANAKAYPAFVNRETGETIPAGVNLRKLCCKHRLTQPLMWAVICGRQKHHKGWVLTSKLGD